MLCFGTCTLNIVFVETNLIVYWSIVHLKQGDVIFVGELVKVPVRDHFPDLAIDVAVSLVRVQDMVLSHPHQQVAGCDVLAIVEVMRCFLSLDRLPWRNVLPWWSTDLWGELPRTCAWTDHSCTASVKPKRMTVGESLSQPLSRIICWSHLACLGKIVSDVEFVTSSAREKHLTNSASALSGDLA